MVNNYDSPGGLCGVIMHSVRKVRTTAEQQEAKRKKDAVENRKYLDLQSRVFAARANSAPAAASLELTTDLLELNPEHYTVWNYRRELLTELNDNALLQKDLRLIEQLMVRYPKVYWLWNHRRWVLKQLGSEAPWDRELGLVTKMLEYDGRNFHGWRYRREVVKTIEEIKGQSMAEEELKYTTSKINANFSNFSAWFNRSQLLDKVAAESKEKQLQAELEYSRSAVFMDPEDQSAWTYYRWLLTNDQFKAEQAKVIHNEIEQIKELAEEEPDSVLCIYTLWILTKKIGQHQPELIDRLIELDPMRGERYKYMKREIS